MTTAELRQAAEDIQWWEHTSTEGNCPGCLEAAVKLANAYLAEHPGWTKEPPTEPGWYWWRYGPGTRPGMVCLFQTGAVRHALAHWAGEKEPTPAEMGGEWAGPLTPPES